MIFRIFFASLCTVALISSGNAAPLWHSIVLDSYDGTLGLTMGPMSGSNSEETLFGSDVITSDSITGRRDAIVGRTASNGDTVNFTGTGTAISLDSSATSAGLKMVLQNDYDLLPNGTATGGAVNAGAVAANGLDMTGSSVIASSGGYSKFVLEIDSTAGYEVTFTALGADAVNVSTNLSGSYAQATKTTSGGVESLEFDLSDFDVKEGLFGTNTINGNEFFTWSDVYGFAISVSGANVVGASNFTLSETFATIPEPSSMLAVAGLFGGVGLLGFRRKRAILTEV